MHILHTNLEGEYHASIFVAGFLLHHSLNTCWGICDLKALELLPYSAGKYLPVPPLK